ncbi:DNA primase [Pleionea sp. CnH1-48]|uniref:DNA primase n=1 Tax=Pleionea sp. CnH1-48 TaxID=2954494 RepID=UPI00209737BC|nr:DNA primase [Pleionea sp. CnH1-48]MCO7225612.1 DNA primase [Pleionea sp. CnH1-48]
MAGRIPKSFIDDVLDKTDIVELIDQRVQLKKAGRNYQACCPFHNEKTPSFSVSPEKQFYYCFGCGATGNAITFVMEYDRLEFVDAIEDLAHNLGMDVPREAQEQPQRQWSHDLYELMSRAAVFYQQQLRKPGHERAIEYLKNRGLSGEIAKDFKLGFVPDEWHSLSQLFGQQPSMNKALVDCGLLIQKENNHYDRFRDRIMFPIRDRRGRVIAFGGRVLDKGEPKYLNSPETEIFHKGQELYGLYEVRQANRKVEWITVVEGYMDVVSLAQFGIRNAVATLGTATSSAHIHQLFRVCPKIIFCFDGDRAGRDAALRALNQSLNHIRDNREIRFMFLPDGEDPDTQVRKIGADAFSQQLQKAPTLFEFLFEHLKSQVDLNTFEGPGKLANIAKPFVNQIEDPIHRERFLASLSKDVGLSEQKLTQLLDEHQPQTPAPAPAAQKASSMSQLTPVRKIIKVLLHKGSYVETIDDYDWLPKSRVAGKDLLYQMLEILRNNPHMSTGALIEHWRGTQYEPHLNKLINDTPVIPIEEMAQEIPAIMVKLKEETLVQRREELVARDRTGPPLTPEERKELRSLY